MRLPLEFIEYSSAADGLSPTILRAINSPELGINGLGPELASSRVLARISQQLDSVSLPEAEPSVFSLNPVVFPSSSFLLNNEIQQYSMPILFLSTLEATAQSISFQFDNLKVDVGKNDQALKDHETFFADLQSQLTKLVAESNQLSSGIAAIDVKHLFSVKEKHEMLYAQVFQGLRAIQNRLDLDRVNKFSLDVNTFILELIDTFYQVNVEYQILNLKHTTLFERLTAMLELCTNTYVDMLNASYIQGGDFIRVRKEQDLIYVSAFLPILDPCEKAQPIWKQSEVIIKDNPVTCPPSKKPKDGDCEYFVEVKEDLGD